MISIAKAGGYDCLQYVEFEDESQHTKGANYDSKENASTEEESVIVETYACGVNYADVIIRWGLYKTAKETVGWPITPGFEFSGKITHVGEKVTDFKIGDDVFGVTMFGGYSQRIKVPQNQIRKIPKNMTTSQAGGFLTVALTAWYAMFESCKLRRGDKILIHSVAGGVGSMLLQMGKIIGCHVTGIVGNPSKVDFVKELGMGINRYLICSHGHRLWLHPAICC